MTLIMKAIVEKISTENNNDSYCDSDSACNHNRLRNGTLHSHRNNAIAIELSSKQVPSSTQLRAHAMASLACSILLHSAVPNVL